MISPTGNSTIISIIFFDLALTPSIIKNHLSNFDINNSPSISLFVDSVQEPFQLLEGYPSYVLLIDPSVVPSFGLNHDPSSVPSLIFFIVSTYTTLQPGTIQYVLSTIVTDIDPTSNICSSFATSFEIRFLLFLKQFIMTKSLFHSDITSLNESFIIPCIMLSSKSTSMLFEKSSTLNLSFIPFSSQNPDQRTGGATVFLYRLHFQFQHRLRFQFQPRL